MKGCEFFRHETAGHLRRWFDQHENAKPPTSFRLTIVRPVVAIPSGDGWASFINLGQKLISTRETLNISQIGPDWAGDCSAWPKKVRWS